MHLKQLLEELSRYKVELRTDGQRLRYRSKESLPPKLLEGLREHKESLIFLALLEERCPGGPEQWPETARVLDQMATDRNLEAWTRKFRHALIRDILVRAGAQN